MTYKVALPRGRWKYGFKAIDAAVAYAAHIHRRTGVFVAVEAYTPRQPRKLTAGERKLIREYLEAQFPWLLDDDADTSGADVVQQLSDIHVALSE